MGLPGPELSIVIPTRNEEDCILPLLTRLAEVLEGIAAEVIFVDDSDDTTPARIRAAAADFGFRVHLIHRPPGARQGGLGGAVVSGIRAAAAPQVCVMDADLQHPPEMILELREAAADGSVDLVAASRDLAAIEDTALIGWRAAFSRTLNRILRGSFRGRLRDLPDPLSGMFLVRRERLDLDRLSPQGYKILLEILIRHPDLRVASREFRFRPRSAGVSKLGPAEGLRFLYSLAGLSMDYHRSLLRFLLVGLSGLLVNSVLLWLLVEPGWLNYLAGAVLAAQGSTLWNFLGTERWVFPAGRNRKTGPQRLGSFWLMNNIFLLVRAPVLALFVDGLGMNYLFANLLSIALMAAARFSVSKSWIWAKQAAAGQRPTWRYDVHGIVTISSSVRLPELEHFRTAGSVDSADLAVVTCSRAALPPDSGATTYDEGFGDAGFWVRFRTGPSTQVFASQMLERSPHVLYTNVVEPILRWILVRKGYALVHGACLVHRGQGLLISAATDTGKTTTILKSLAAFPFEFLSDDMVILDRKGQVFAYPKPLTISRHTLRAVPAADLTPLERLKLQVQSGIHSRLGRRIGIFLGAIRLPAATLNAYLQMLVPPPKFAIERLVPGVVCAERAVLSYLAVIERGPANEGIIAQDEVYPIIARNIEDAYGFPPYPQIEEHLRHWKGKDLHRDEETLIGQAIAGLPAVRLQRDDYAWWQRVPAIYHGDLFGVSDPLSRRYPTIPRRVAAEPRG